MSDCIGIICFRYNEHTQTQIPQSIRKSNLNGDNVLVQKLLRLREFIIKMDFNYYKDFLTLLYNSVIVMKLVCSDRTVSSNKVNAFLEASDASTNAVDIDEV